MDGMAAASNRRPTPDDRHVELLCKSAERRSSSGRSGDGPDGDINGGEEGETRPA
jgi:hypothetical protein